MNIIYLIDFNCPYSYIGIKRLQKALSNQNLDGEWEMKSFELEPELGKRPTLSTTERYSEKYEMTEKEAESKIKEIENIALNDGLKINYRDMLLTSSINALRLCKFTQNMHPELTLNLAEEIFHANMVENKNIADPEVLTKIGVSCGLEESETRKIVENNYYNIEAYLDKEEALTHGITATPCFILNHKGQRLIIPGVFTTEEFETALKDIVNGEISDKTFV